MRSLIVLSLVFTASLALPSVYKKNGEISALGHIKKRSFNHGAVVFEPTTFYTAPASVYAAPASVFVPPSAVSHQSREDVRISQTVVSTSPVASPALVNVYQSPSVYTVSAQNVYPGGAAVSHQSRVDAKTSSVVLASPVVAHQSVLQSVPTVVEDAPVVGVGSVYVASAPSSLYQPSVYASTW